MKFEYPSDIYHELKNKDRDGTAWTWNKDKVNERWNEEYKNRIKFLDLALAIEQGIDNLISCIITQDRLYTYFIEEVVLSKIDFRDKIEIFRTLLLENLFSRNNLNLRIINNKEIHSDNFIIKLNKFIETLDLIRDIRNHSVHHGIPLSSTETIIKPSRKRIFQYKEIKKEELLIRGHFILWILQNFKKEYNRINKEALENYYLKYKSILTDLATLKSEEEYKT